MGRSDRLLGALVCWLLVVFLLCVCLLVAMVATDAANLGPDTAPSAGGGRANLATGSPAQFWSSKRRIPKGPDPIHNRRAEKATIAPRRRD
ncbi:CLAVATA3/ESR (CLE)-related protein 25-like [Phragmites australis]|uniref:CLAVATA3/ESR (CLE)-related protein 25-like n=1 Tax=Phragmites australis TaxID=29695 RepID=UPI002D7724F7|nr:CLAVATA3/ESR (CLE)-related protein 25-like [Phragmites australis]